MEKIYLKNKSIVQIKRQLNKYYNRLYPVYINNDKLRKKIFLFGWKNGYSIISWPSLPKVNKFVIKIWSKHLFCVIKPLKILKQLIYFKIIRLNLKYEKYRN